MITHLITSEIDEFISSEVRRTKEQEALGQDADLKKAGITKDYLQLVEEAIETKDLKKAKKYRDELEGLVKNIEDPIAKDKAALVGIEVNNVIELQDKIEKNKKDFELRIKKLEGDNAGSGSFFSEEPQEGIGAEKVSKMLTKGISAKQNDKEESSFFSSQPDKITVIENIVNPNTPMPSGMQPQNLKSGGRNIVVNTPPIQITAPPIQMMPQRIKAELVEDPKKGHEQEFSKASFLIHEMESFLTENEWRRAKAEYNEAHDLIERLPMCEEREILISKLFEDYHKIKAIEAQWKKQQEEEAKKKAENAKNAVLNAEKERETKLAKLKIIEEKRKKATEMLAQERQERMKKMHKVVQEHHEQKRVDKNKVIQQQEYKTNTVQPPMPHKLPDSDDLRSHADRQQDILEAKHEAIKKGKIPEFVNEAEKALNHDRSLKAPKELFSKTITHINKNPEEMYKRAVSLIYNDKKSEAKQLLQELLKIQPTDLAAQIRLKECET